MEISKLRFGGAMLAFSITVNVALLGIAIIGEKYGHAYRDALERRGLVERKAEAAPDYWAIVGWTNTLDKLNLNCDAAFFGNSITKGSDFQKFFPDLSIVNLGYPGDDLLGMSDRVSMIKAVNPKTIFIMAGTNDLFHCTEKRYTERYAKLLDAIRDSIPQARIIIESVLPMNHSMKGRAPSHEIIVSANNSISNLAKNYEIEFINLYDLYVEDGDLPTYLTRDGIHLYPEAYDKWANAIKPYLYGEK